jgi:N-acetylglutamate synthase-like GNAT family acetyltransferase
VIRKAVAGDLPEIYGVINDAAIAYKGIIPEDRWHEPYMSMEELEAQVRDGVEFSCYVEGATIVGVMGIQDKGDVNLIRHAYVRTSNRGGGIGTQLLRSLLDTSSKPILIGTWKAATWAIAFYEKHGFRRVPEKDIGPLLRKYWNIPQRQVETSVVLADARYSEQASA